MVLFAVYIFLIVDWVFYFFSFKFLCVFGLSVCMYITCVPGAHTGQKASGSLELGYRVVHHCVGAEMQTQEELLLTTGPSH